MVLIQKLEHEKKIVPNNSMYPSELLCFAGGEKSFETEFGHYFGIVIAGTVLLTNNGLEYPLSSGMYFSAPEKIHLNGNGKVVIFLRYGYRGLFLVGGPAETDGRLCYIDNSSTSILCPPPRNGDPCLNLLTFPANIQQTKHIHPTLRFGVVIRGSGHCLVEGKKIALNVEDVFLIPERTVHSFESGVNGLSVVAYHPDSEGGPTDHSHPMLNRTYINR